ncbi:MAG: glycosyltransferase family protein [Anaerolineaceae bacterium]|nr:glycosyltransferase family protein [Anaerolineaceae bacterium]
MTKTTPRDQNTVAIIQARMGSSRLPGKVLRDIGGQPMLYRVVIRARHAQTVGQVVVATTTDPGDDPVEAFCNQQGFPVFRGDPYDVLDRYYQAAVTYHAETVVRLTADCPLLDPSEIDRTVLAFQEAEVDFAANRLPPPWKRTTPIGMDTEVVTMAALTRAWQEADAKYAREHVMPYLYEEPGRFKTLLVDHTPDWGDVRLTVDTPEDLELIRQLTAHFGNGNDFGMAEAVQYLQAHPALGAINAGIQHKTFKDVDDRG